MTLESFLYFYMNINKYKIKRFIADHFISEYISKSTIFNIIKCRENIEHKAKFIKELATELIKRKLPDIEESEIIEMINDIRKYLIKRNNYQIN